MKPQNGTVPALFYFQKTNPLYASPVLQITNLSKFQFGSVDKDRFKANLSDGTFYMKAVFSSEMTNIFERGEIGLYSVIRLNNFTVRPKENNNYLYIQSVSEFEKYDYEIGHPVNISSGKQSLDPAVQTNVPSSKQSYESNNAKLENQSHKENIPLRNTVNSNKIDQVPIRDQTSPKKIKQNDDSITEIKKIFPHKKNFTFKGRVVSKSEIKRFNSQKGEGKLFSFEITDNSGQIKCVAFSEAVDIFYPIIESDSVYTISNVTVKPANKKYSNNNSDFEIQIEKTTEIIKVEDDNIPKYVFKFTKIIDLSSVGGVVDCLGVIKEVYPTSKVVIKSTGKESSKRDIVIVDQTGSCRLTIWGDKAEEEFEKDVIICAKSVRVGDYNGVNLSTIGSSQIITDLNVPESIDLLAWYQEEGKNIVIEKPKKAPKRSFISEVKENMLEYATIQASVMYLKEDGLYYESCPGENCNKKVFMEDNGIYRCEKCNYSFDNCNYRYMMNIHLGDFTGQHWATLFDEHGKSMFGMTAKEMKELGEQNPEEIHNLIKGIFSKEYQFKIRTREENYNGESKLRSNCLELNPVDYSAEARRMLDAIEKVTM